MLNTNVRLSDFFEERERCIEVDIRVIISIRLVLL
jgi:hypothetical protein